jgi:hypothetical protein
MTMPDERTRALRWAREFLEEIQRTDLWPTVSEDLRRQAQVILRHFPTNAQLNHFHIRVPDLFGPHEERPSDPREDDPK